MTYQENIIKELTSHLAKHDQQVLNYYRGDRGKKKPSNVKNHDKLIDLFWKSAGMWKWGNRV